MEYRDNQIAAAASAEVGVVLEAAALVAGCDDFAVLRPAIEECGGHLGGAEGGSVRQICDTLDCADVGREAALGFSLQAAFVTGRYGRRKGAP